MGHPYNSEPLFVEFVLFQIPLRDFLLDFDNARRKTPLPPDAKLQAPDFSPSTVRSWPAS
jgi:hypothetical protein